MGLLAVGLRGRRRGLRGSGWAGGTGGGAAGAAPGAPGVGQRGRTRGTTGRRRWGFRGGTRVRRGGCGASGRHQGHRGGAGVGRATLLAALGVGGGEREGGAV